MKSVRTLIVERVNWDIYTILMVALVPVLLLSAWGLTEVKGRRLHGTQCEMAITWLQESEKLVPQFNRARTLEYTAGWVATMEELDSPAAAGRLRWGILQSARYSAEYFPSLPTDQVAVLNPIDGLYERNIEEGAQDLINHCPEVESLLPDAFPMVFREDAFS